MKQKKGISQWFFFFLLGSALIIFYKVIDDFDGIFTGIGWFLHILTPFIIGFVIAFLLYAPARRIEGFLLKRKWKFWKKAARPLSVIVVYLLALGVLALVSALAIPALVNALVDFVNSVPTYYNNVMGFLQEYTKPGGLLENFDIREKVQELYGELQKYLTVDRILSYVQSVVSFTSSIVDVLMAVIVSVYMLLGRESLFRAVRSVSGLMMKDRTISVVSEYLHKISKIFYNYVYSQLLDALVVGVLATIGFLLARMPNAPALGIMLGLLNMIPYFGALIGGVICVLFALLSGNLYGALFVAIYILVMQQIDANIIQPRIVGQTVGLKPIYVLLGITVCGGLFGFWGILIGAPVMAVVQLLLTDYIASRNRTKTKTWSIPENKESE